MMRDSQLRRFGHVQSNNTSSPVNNFQQLEGIGRTGNIKARPKIIRTVIIDADGKYTPQPQVLDMI